MNRITWKNEGFMIDTNNNNNALFLQFIAISQ